MVQSTHTTFSLPTVNWLAFTEDGHPEPAWPLPDVLRGVAAASPNVGLDEASVRSFQGQGGTVDELASLVDRLGLRCTDVGILWAGAGDALERAETLARLASTLGAPTCVTAFAAAASRRAIDRLAVAADVLASAGARLAVEWAPYGALRTLEEAVDVCSGVGWDRCGLLLDLWHIARSGCAWSAVDGLHRDQVELVHLSDAPVPMGPDLRYESRFRRLPPGEGVLPTARFVAALERIGYGGVVSVEVLSGELRALPPERGARLLVDALLDVWPRSDAAGA